MAGGPGQPSRAPLICAAVAGLNYSFRRAPVCSFAVANHVLVRRSENGLGRRGLIDREPFALITREK